MYADYCRFLLEFGFIIFTQNPSLIVPDELGESFGNDSFDVEMTAQMTDNQVNRCIAQVNTYILPQACCVQSNWLTSSTFTLKIVLVMIFILEFLQDSN